MFFFFFSDTQYAEVGEYIEAHNDETREVLKRRMQELGLNNTKVAELLNENKSGISRFFSSGSAITAEKAQRIARALGGVLRLEDIGTDQEHLFFDTETDGFASLLKRIQDETDEDFTDYLVSCELPTAIRNELGIDSRDYIISTTIRKKQRILPNDPISKAYEITIMSRFCKDIEFDVFITPDREYVVFQIGIPIFVASSSSDDVKEYRRVLELESEGEPIFIGFDPSSIGMLQQEELLAKTIYSDSIQLESEGEALYSSLRMAFDKYLTLLQDKKGVAPTRRVSEAPTDITTFVMPAEIKEEVVKERGTVCDIDPTHELFEGADGMPYVEIIPIVPINERMKQKYGQKLITKANAAILCPMCRAKLEHGSQVIREDIILKLYDKRIEEMRAAGLEVSRTEILFSRFLEDEYKQNPSWDSLFKNIKKISQVKEDGK